MNIEIQLPKIELKGKAVLWSEKDPGFAKYAGSIYFENNNYMGFLRHDGKVEVKRNFRFLGLYEPNNFIYA